MKAVCSFVKPWTRGAPFAPAKLNIPKNWILTRDALFQLATKRSLSDRVLLESLSDREVQRHRFTLRRLHREARMTAQRNNQTSPQGLLHTVKQLQAKCEEYAERLNIGIEILASKKDLLFAIRSYLRGRELPSWFGSWRTELIGPAVDACGQRAHARIEDLSADQPCKIGFGSRSL